MRNRCDENLDLVFHLDYENIWSIGFKVGFFSWLALTVISVINKYKKQKM